jgi:uncharacterized membrane protein
MNTKYIAAGLAAAAVSVLGASNAHAWLKFCNGTPDRAFVAISYLDENRCSGIGDWFDEGWFAVEPNQCSIVLGGDLTNTFYYYYAESGSRIYSGDFMTDCIPRSAFGQCADFCTYHDVSTYGMREINTGGADNYSLSLLP